MVFPEPVSPSSRNTTGVRLATANPSQRQQRPSASLPPSAGPGPRSSSPPPEGAAGVRRRLRPHAAGLQMIDHVLASSAPWNVTLQIMPRPPASSTPVSRECRDSKVPDGPRLAVPAAVWSAFVSAYGEA
ncbi:DUF397 domain-containing protein [Streptomyces pacificus]|uniref:DUF397 domain-containing protein n=1 Tax=Streptomyces pacificus TaxID=2705029 RepID=UPI0035317768